MFTGRKPAPRSRSIAADEVGHLEREVMRTGAVPRDEAGEEVVLFGRPRFEQLDAHAVAVGVADEHLHRTEADRTAAEDDGAAERAGEEPERSEVSAAASATWSRAYWSTGSDQVVTRDAGAPRPGSGEDAGEHPARAPRTTRPPTASSR